MIIDAAYTILDIDLAWYHLLRNLEKLSDGTEIPIFFEVQRGDVRYEKIPNFNVSLIKMIPNYEDYEGWDEMSCGYTVGADGNPINEVYIRQPEHYLMQYRLKLTTKEYMHRIDAMLRLQLLLTPRPVLVMEHLKNKPSIQGEFNGHYGLTPEAAQRDSEILGEEELLQDIWTYLVPVSFPHPKTREFSVIKMIEWRMKNVSSIPDGTEEESTDFERFYVTEPQA